MPGFFPVTGVVLSRWGKRQGAISVAMQSRSMEKGEINGQFRGSAFQPQMLGVLLFDHCGNEPRAGAGNRGGQTWAVDQFVSNDRAGVVEFITDLGQFSVEGFSVWKR